MVAQTVESALESAIATVLGLIGSVTGLNTIPMAIQNLINSVRMTVQSLITQLISLLLGLLPAGLFGGTEEGAVEREEPVVQEERQEPVVREVAVARQALEEAEEVVGAVQDSRPGEQQARLEGARQEGEAEEAEVRQRRRRGKAAQGSRPRRERLHLRRHHRSRSSPLPRVVRRGAIEVLFRPIHRLVVGFLQMHSAKPTTLSHAQGVSMTLTQLNFVSSAWI